MTEHHWIITVIKIDSPPVSYEFMGTIDGLTALVQRLTQDETVKDFKTTPVEVKP